MAAFKLSHNVKVGLTVLGLWAAFMMVVFMDMYQKDKTERAFAAMTPLNISIKPNVSR